MSTPQVRMDKSREFSTVHGERTPDDPHAGVHFYQDGLPFDSLGILVANHPELTAETPQAQKLRDLVERKMRKLNKQKVVEEPAPVALADDDDDDDATPKAKVDDDDDGDKPVNLEAWARGEQKVIWNEVSQAIARRFSRRVSGKVDALELLIDERVVALGALSPEHQKLLKQA